MSRRTSFACWILTGLLLGYGRPVGAQLWASSVEGAAGTGDYGHDLHVLPSGDVVATGVVDNVGGDPTQVGNDLVVVRFSGSDGALVWRQDLTGTAAPGVNYGDYGMSVAGDSAGDVFVAGATENTGSGRDFTVVKLAGGTGAEIWRTELSGNSMEAFSVDEASGIVVDATGAAYAVGRLSNVDGSVLVVLKLDGSTGAILWRTDVPNSFTGGFASNAWRLALDPAGAVIAGGSLAHDGRFTFAVLKFDSATGAELWRYEGRADTIDCHVNDVAVANHGDVAAAGYCHSGPGSTYGFTVAALAGGTGAELWYSRTFTSGPPFEGTARGVTFDGAGDVIATGYTALDFQHGHVTVAKFDGGDGDLRWQRRLPYGRGAFDTGIDVVVTPEDDVVVAGKADVGVGSGGGEAIVVARLASADGAARWRQQLDSSSHVSGGGVALDANADVLVVGSMSHTSSTPDVVVAKLDGDTGGSYTLTGGRLALRDHASRPDKRSLAVVVRSPSVPPPGSSGDPRMGGGTLTIANPDTGESAVLSLPASRWSGIGSPSGSRGYRYADGAQASGPCTRVVLKQNRLTAICRGALIPFTLDEPSQGTLTVVLTTGTGALQQCAGFGGVLDLGSVSGRAVYRGVPLLPPASCP